MPTTPFSVKTFLTNSADVIEKIAYKIHILHDATGACPEGKNQRAPVLAGFGSKENSAISQTGG
jgi:hypothetical protein